MSPFQKRLNLARGVLALAVVALGLAHCFPVIDLLSPTRLSEIWPHMGNALHDAFNGRPDWFALLFSVLYVVPMVCFAVLPFSAGLLSRATALRWTQIALTIMPAAAGLVYFMTVAKGALDLVGLMLFLNALSLAAIGTVLIPRAGAEPPRNGRKFITVITLGVLLCLLPWVTRWWRDTTGITECRKILASWEQTLRDYEARAGHFPELETQDVMFSDDKYLLTSGPDGMIEKFGISPPAITDPWHQGIRYELTPDGGATLSSNGPDHVKGTGDDIILHIAPK